MKLGQFTFKREPMWMLLFSLAPAVVGMLTVFIVVLIVKLAR
jgi:hypothetical protein